MLKKSIQISLSFLSLWLISSVALSNGSTEPELPIAAQARTSVEYPLLKRLQNLTLDLQLLEITIKNRRDAQTEEKMEAALKLIEDEGNALSDRFKEIRTAQLDALYPIFLYAKRYSDRAGVRNADWDNVFKGLLNGQISSGTLTVHKKSGAPLNVLTLSPLYVGRQVVWNVSMPALDRQNFWMVARAKVKAAAVPGITPPKVSTVTQRLQVINSSFAQGEELAKAYFNHSYSHLYAAFETQRYAILQHIALARKTLTELGKTNTAMGTPEEFSSLYNQTLDNLFSYGIDISLAGAPQRDFALKGFLFAEDPKTAQELLQKLKYAPNLSTYNPPST